MANEEAEVVAVETNDKGNDAVEADTISIPKKDYEKMNQDLGSLKRELKDFKKTKVEPTEKIESKSDDRVLEKLEKFALRAAGVTHADDIKLAQDTAKKWGVDIDDVLADEDFKVKLGRQQTGRTNVEATSGVRGGGSSGTQAKNTSEYWIAKGNPPTPTDVPDRKVRAKITRDMMAAAKNGGKKFYNS